VTQGLDATFKVMVKDSQSNPNRAAEVAKEVIMDDGVDLILVAITNRKPSGATEGSVLGPFHVADRKPLWRSAQRGRVSFT